MDPNLVVAIDLGEASLRALAWAAEMQKTTGGKIWGIHVMRPMLATGVTGAPMVTVRPEDITAFEVAVKEAMASAGAGSVAEQVVRHAPCPVVTLRGG